MTATMAPGRQRKVLMLAYVFPPFFSVGGSIRAVKFARYLPELGWQPLVLTIDDSKEYDTQRRQGSESLLAELPPQVRIFRTGAGEPSAGLLQKGREARRRNRAAAVVVNSLGRVRGWAGSNLMLPDQYIAWLPFALKDGRRLARQERVDALFATCPPHSAAVIGAALKRLTGKPLVLDYRDDWIDTPRYLAKPRLARAVERLQERWAVATADRVVLVTEWSRRAFVARYPGQPAGKFVLIPNGVDLEQFPADVVERRNGGDGHFRIVHAGLLSVASDWHRSPEGLFRAVSRVLADEPALVGRLRLTFTGRLPEPYRRLADDMGLAGVVEEAGYLSQPDLVRLMARADLLLAINYEGFATLIPGKIYEYWAVGGPPILLLSCEGAASDLISRYGLGLTVPPDDGAAIEAAVLGVFRRREAGSPWLIERKGVEVFDRKALAERMAGTLSGLVAG